ncbi:hypothetical protein CENSYa_0707 [Cenarchaeum symbiosum A]|uniref:Uncharacterized protein n=1 Tax=Cenarchaeum symbiosum (strain A) TaxID=414004 RepID=A0RVH3_CENSY|nr:hypothetical protein CENSYa_0707 [Cenarchaeum symbiosum A]
MYVVTDLGNTFPLDNWEGASDDIERADESGVALFSGAPRIVERDNAGRIFTDGNGRFELRPAGTYMGMDGVDVVAAVYERTAYMDIPVGKLGAKWHYNGTSLEYLLSTTPSTIEYEHRGIPAPGYGGTIISDSSQGVTISGDGYAIISLKGITGGLHLHGEGAGRNAEITFIESEDYLFNGTVSDDDLLDAAVPSVIEFVPVSMAPGDYGAGVPEDIAGPLNVYGSRLPVGADFALHPEEPLPSAVRDDDTVWSYTEEDGNPWDPFFLPTYRMAAAGGPYAGLHYSEDGACRVFDVYEYEGAYVLATVAGAYLHIVHTDSMEQYTVDISPHGFVPSAGIFADAGDYAPWPGEIHPPWGEQSRAAYPVIAYEVSASQISENATFSPDRLGRIIESRGSLDGISLEPPGYEITDSGISVSYGSVGTGGPASCGIGGLQNHSILLEYLQGGVFVHGDAAYPGQYSRIDYAERTDVLLLVRMDGGSLTFFNGAPADDPGIYDAPANDVPGEEEGADLPPEPPLARALYFVPEYSPGYYLDLVPGDGCYVQLNDTERCIIRHDRGSLYYAGDDGWKTPDGRILSRNGPSDVPRPEDLGRIVYDWHLPWDKGLWYFAIPEYPGRYFNPLPHEYAVLGTEYRCYTGMLPGDIEDGICRIEWNSDTLGGCWAVRTDNQCMDGIDNGRNELPTLEQLGAEGVYWPGPEGYIHGGNPAEFSHPAAPGHTMDGTPHTYSRGAIQYQCYVSPGHSGQGGEECVILSNYEKEHCWRHVSLDAPAHCVSSNPPGVIPSVIELAGDAFAAGGAPAAIFSVTGLPDAPYELLAGIPEVRDHFVVPGTEIPLAFEPYYYDHRYSYRDYYCYRGAEDSGREGECVIRYARSAGGPVCWVHAELPGTCLSGNAKLNPPGWRELAGGAPGTVTTGISAGISGGTVRGEFSAAGEHYPYDYTLRMYTGALYHDFAGDPEDRLVIFDKQNDAAMLSVMPLEPPRRILYNAGTYVQVPFPGDVHLENVTIGHNGTGGTNGTGGCPGCGIFPTGISGGYLEGERAYIPVVPAHNTVRMEIDGEGTRFDYSDVASPTGIRIPDRTSSHTSEESDGPILLAGTRASAHASAVAPSGGTMKVLVSGTADGNILIGNNWVGTEVDYQCVFKPKVKFGRPINQCTDMNSDGSHCWDRSSGRKYGHHGCSAGGERRLWLDLSEAPSSITAVLKTYVNGELRGEDVIAQAAGKYANGAEALDHRPEVSCRQGFKTVFGSSGPHTTPLGVACSLEDMRAEGFERSSTKYSKSFGSHVTGYERHVSPELAGYYFEGVQVTGSASVDVGAGDFVEFELIVEASAEADAQEFLGVKLRGQETGLRGSGYSDAELELGSLSFITAL